MPEFVLTGQVQLRGPSNLDSIKRDIQNKFNNLSVIPLNQIPALTNQMKKFNAEMGKSVFISRDIDESITSIGSNLGKTVRRFGAFTVATTALFGVIRSFQANIKEAILFEKELLKISQVTGTSVKGLSDLKNEITDLSTTLGVGSTKLLNVARVLAQAGLAANDVKVTLGAIAKSDLAPTFDTVEQTTEGVVAVMRQFKKEAKDIEGILGSINSVSGKFAVESEDLIQFIRGAGGTFEAAGGTIEELFGLGTSIRATTRESAASIATGLRTIFARLQRTRTQDFLEDFNIQLRLTSEEAKKFGRTEGEFVGPFEAIRRLSIALQQIPSTDPRFAQITEELGGFRQINKVIPLIKQNVLAQQAYNVALQGTNSLNKDAEKALESLSNKLDRLAEKFIDISRVLLENDGVKSLINQMIQLSNVVLDSIKSVSSLANLLSVLPVISLLGSRPFIQGFQGIKRNRGGSVPGAGNTDTVPAMLTPGEFVLRKSAVASIGLAKLTKMNATGKVEGFNAGGLVGDTIRQVQGAGIIYGISTAIGNFNKDLKELADGVNLAATTFVILSLGSKAFSKDFSKATEEATANIKALTQNLSNLKSETGEGRTSILDSKGKQHLIMDEVAKEISGLKTGGGASLDSKIDRVSVLADHAKQIEQNARNLKNESIKSSREDAAGVKTVAAFRVRENTSLTRNTGQSGAISDGSIDLGGVQLVPKMSSSGKMSHIQFAEGREFVTLRDLEGRESEFYRSLMGTGGKNQGEWYPTGGVAKMKGNENWIIKGNVHQDPAYGRPDLENLRNKALSVLPKNDTEMDQFINKVLNRTDGSKAHNDPDLQKKVLDFSNIEGDQQGINRVFQSWESSQLSRVWGQKGQSVPGPGLPPNNVNTNNSLGLKPGDLIKPEAVARIRSLLEASLQSDIPFAVDASSLDSIASTLKANKPEDLIKAFERISDGRLLRRLSRNNEVVDARFGSSFSAKQTTTTDAILEEFASGKISGRQVTEAFKFSEFAGDFRNLIKQVGVDGAREVIKRSMFRGPADPSMQFAVSQNDDLQPILSSISGKSQSEQVAILQKLEKLYDINNLESGKVITNKDGKVISRTEAKEIDRAEFLNQGSDLSRYMSNEEKLLIEKAKKQQKILQYLSTEEGAKKEIANIEAKRKVIQDRILQRTNILRSLEPNAKNDAFREKLDAENTKDASSIAGLNRRKESVNAIRSREMFIEANSIENQTKRQNDLIKSEEAKIALNNRLEFSMTALSFGINAVAAGMISYGQYLDQEASKRLNSFRKGTGDSDNLAREIANAKGLTGAGVGLAGGSFAGAQLGTLAAPLLGPAAPFAPLIGLLGGGLIGSIGIGLTSFNTALSEAEETINTIVRNRTLDKFEEALVKASNGTISTFSASSTVRSGSSNALSELLTLQGDSGREDLGGRLEAMRIPLQDFINKVSTSVSSLSEFNSVVGEDTIRLFLTLNNTPIQKFNEEILKNIQISAKSRIINTNLIKANQDLMFRAMTQRTLVSSVNETIFTLDKNLSVLDSTISSIDGNFKSNLNLTGIEKLGKTGNIVKFDEFERDILQLGNIFGSAGKLIADNSIRSAKALQVLPSILLDVNSRSNLEGIGEFTTKIDDQLAKSGVGKDIRDILVAQIDGIIGPEAKDQNIIEKLKTDFEGTLAQITKGLAGLSDPLRDASSMFQTKFNQIGDLLDQRANIESKLQASFVKTLEVYEQSERILANTFGTEIDFSKLLRLDNMAQFDITRTPNLVNNPAEVADRLYSSQEALRQSQYDLNNSTNLTAQEMLDLREKISNQKSEVGTLTSALEFMGDVTKRTAIFQEALNKQQKDRQTKFGFAETLAFGSQQEQRQLIASIQLTNRAIQDGGLENFSADQKKQVQELLNKVGDTALFKDGLTGNKVKELLVGNNIKRLGGDARGVAFAGAEEKALQNKILQAVGRAQEAQNALYTNLAGQNKVFNDQLTITLKTFVTDLNTTFNAAAIDNLQQEVNRKKTTLESEKIKSDQVTSLEKSFGIDLATIKSVFSTLSEADKIQKNVNNLSNREKFTGADFINNIKQQKKALGSMELERVFTGMAGGGYNTPATATYEMLIPTEKSSLLIKKLEEDLTSRIGDKQTVADLMSEIAKTIIPSSIGKIGDKDFIDPKKLFEGIDNSIEAILKSKTEQLILQNDNRKDALGLLNEDPKKAEDIAGNILKLGPVLDGLSKSLGENFNLNETNRGLETLTTEINLLNERIGNLRGKPMSNGGLVGGNGNRDSISARLMPGEFVLNRKTVERVGISNLNRLNKSNSKAPVASSNASTSNTSNSMAIAQESLTQLNRAMQTFAFNVERLEKAFSSFPTEITITGKHYVEVVINGAQVLQSIKPEIASLIESGVKSSINKMLRDKFPDKGQVI